MADTTSDNSFHALSDIDKLVHEPARLMILSYLSVINSADFTFLMKQTELTRGNLSSHISKLEEAGYVKVSKEFVDKIPRTLIRITTKGKNALKKYRDKMQNVIDSIS
ncbi:MAG: transcriptional regulator [Candidatus Cloacimonetes bacterium]|nr:transcriptional regulator [Candidatus Cloacimonadota bacterium]